MKKFLLIAGDYLYPQADTRDWKGCYATYEEAKSHITVKDHKTFLLDGHPVDWYDIVNLEEWMNK